MAYNSKKSNRIRKKQRIKPIRVVPVSSPMDTIKYSSFGGNFVSFEGRRLEQTGLENYPLENRSSNEESKDSKYGSGIFELSQTELSNLEDSSLDLLSPEDKSVMMALEERTETHYKPSFEEGLENSCMHQTNPEEDSKIYD